MARNRLVFMRWPERFAGAFIICNWIVCLDFFCPFISPFVNYSLSPIYKVQYLDFGWSQSIQSKVQCKFIDGLLTHQWHHMPIGVLEGSKCMYRAWIFWKILTLLPSGGFEFHELILLYNHFQIFALTLGWIGCLTSQLTIFHSYMWRHIDVQADWRRSWTYGRAPNAIDIS